MASKQQRSEPSVARLPSNRSSEPQQRIYEGKLMEQELRLQGRRFTQEQVVGVEDYEEEEEDEELQDQDEYCTVQDDAEDGHDVAPMPAAPGENSPANLNCQCNRSLWHFPLVSLSARSSRAVWQRSPSPGLFPRGSEAYFVPFMSAMPSNSDPLNSVDGKASFPSFPSHQVEGAFQSCLSAAETQVTRFLQQAMDTVQCQVLRALHQAASNIIEHLGKEAADRIVVAERKAALLELELSSIKQQALSMLLRLKADSDAQALDADKRYLIERRRAQDAEAKLAVAQDISKRLKAELKRKGDIIDKMQELVHPTSEEQTNNLCRQMELPGHLDKCVNILNNDNLKNVAGCHMQSSPILTCKENFHHYENLHGEAQYSEIQHDMEPLVHDVDGCNEGQVSFSGQSPQITKGPIDLQKQTCSTYEEFQTDQHSPVCEEKLSPKMADGGIIDDLEPSDYVEGLNQVENPDANLEEGKLREPLQDARILLDTNDTDEKVSASPVGGQKAMNEEDIIEASAATVKGFYVRRKVKESGKLQEKRSTDVTIENHSLHVDSEPDLKVDIMRSSTESASELNAVPAEEQQTSGVVYDSKILQDVVDSSNVEHARQMAPELCVDCSNELAEEVSSSEISKSTEMNSSILKNDEIGENVDFARPDYEVATSLAELASIGLEVRSVESESFPQRDENENIFLKPGRTGLRMKRKGISFEKKVAALSEGKVSKKSRSDKSDSGLTDSHTERVVRKNRGSKYKFLKDALSQSSRDNRRLMQGARQVPF
ncbi:hypothetical protein KP509_08G004600 [Ceratopteris richardii]|uniref:Uncharacterized protein n=1 Tax=Ceratopteris richardii TaxID=49495 RepID=A0A8T2UAF1_CERRI|nr:hypothetical protein KP509_08G004600 [Ceratopteris richardii]